MTKKPAAADAHPASALELVADDGVRLASLVYAATLYTGATLSKNAKGVLAIYDRFLEWCPREALTFLRHRKHAEA